MDGRRLLFFTPLHFITEKFEFLSPHRLDPPLNVCCPGVSPHGPPALHRATWFFLRPSHRLSGLLLQQALTH